jgi:hypothetical protein
MSSMLTLLSRSAAPPPVTAGLVCKVNWGRSRGFVIGLSQIGGGDQIGYGNDPAFSGPYDDVSADVMSVSWKRGRAQDLGPSEAGSHSWTLKDRNADGSYRGRYNRLNPASPLVVAGQLRPTRPAKIEWNDRDGNTWPVAYGWLRAGTADASTSKRTASFEFIDLFSWLATQFPVIAPTDSQVSTGEAFRLLLEACGWTNPALMDLEPGNVIGPFAWNYSTAADASAATVYHSVLDTETVSNQTLSLRSGLDCASELLQVSLGAFFQAADGVVTYRTRHASDRATAYASVGATVLASRTGFDVEKVKNRYQVTRQGLDGTTGAPVVYVDDVSAQEFGVRDGTAVASALIPDDTYARVLASALTDITKDPDALDLAWGLTLVNQTDAASRAAVFGADLQQILEVTDPVLGGTTSFVIESVSGSAVPGQQSTDGAVATLTLGLRKLVPTTPVFLISATAPSQVGGPNPMKF